MTLFALINKDTSRIPHIHHFEVSLNKRQKMRDFLYLCQIMDSRVIHLYSNKVINIQIAYSVVD